jgi:hypothetical protein
MMIRHTLELQAEQCDPNVWMLDSGEDLCVMQVFNEYQGQYIHRTALSYRARVRKICEVDLRIVIQCLPVRGRYLNLLTSHS